MHGKQWVCIVFSASVAAMTASFAANPIAASAPPPAVSSTPKITPVGTAKPAISPVITPAGAVSAKVPATTVSNEAQSAQIWNLKNADIRAVIQTISILTGKNFIVDPRVQGNVTLISQKPMTPDEMYQVFLSMLQLLQFSAIPAGGIVKIVPATDGIALTHQIATTGSPGKGEEIVVRVVPVQQVSATELVPVLRPLMPQTASITAYPPSNSLILAGTASNIERLTQIIAQMDVQNANQITVVHLRYANAKKVVEMIKALQGSTQGGVGNSPVLVADDENNSILVNANAANQISVRELVGKLDQPGAGGDNTKVVTLNYLTAKKVAPIIAKIASGMGSEASSGEVVGGSAKGAKAAASDFSGSGNISVQAEDQNNALIIHAPNAVLKSLLRVVHRLDVQPQEVLVEAIIVKVDEDLLNKLGIEWGSPTIPIGSSTTNADGTESQPGLIENGLLHMRIGHGVGLIPNGNMLALLHMLKSNSSSDILSTPSVVVLNNDKASIDDGQNIGVANTSYDSGAAGSNSSSATPAPGPTTVINQPYNQIQRQNVTLSLEVTPHVSPNKMIRMELVQEDDSVASEAGVSSSSSSGLANDNPTLNTSQIKTSVLVKSGDVLVLGGLISNQQQKTEQKLPILGNIPLLGRLFTYQTHKLEKESLMVFIRPIIMSKQASSEQTSARYRYVRDQQIEMKTEKASQFTRLQTLPKIGNERYANFPPPVASVSVLPKPSATEQS